MSSVNTFFGKWEYIYKKQTSKQHQNNTKTNKVTHSVKIHYECKGQRNPKVHWMPPRVMVRDVWKPYAVKASLLGIMMTIMCTLPPEKRRVLPWLTCWHILQSETLHRPQIATCKNSPDNQVPLTPPHPPSPTLTPSHSTRELSSVVKTGPPGLLPWG